jgi:hypothetical protein
MLVRYARDLAGDRLNLLSQNHIVPSEALEKPVECVVARSLREKYIGLFATRDCFECSVCLVIQHDAKKSVGKRFDHPNAIMSSVARHRACDRRRGLPQLEPCVEMTESGLTSSAEWPLA